MDRINKGIEDGNNKDVGVLEGLLERTNNKDRTNEGIQEGNNKDIGDLEGILDRTDDEEGRFIGDLEGTLDGTDDKEGGFVHPYTSPLLSLRSTPLHRNRVSPVKLFLPGNKKNAETNCVGCFY